MVLETPVQWIAAIIAVLVIVKILFIAVSKKTWYNGVVKPIYSNPKTVSFVFGILAIVVFYFLIQELTIIQIFSVFAFCSLFMGAALMMFPISIQGLIKKAYSQKFSGWMWVYILIWFLLAAWVLYELFLV
jgi:hypothetical protein